MPTFGVISYSEGDADDADAANESGVIVYIHGYSFIAFSIKLRYNYNKPVVSHGWGYFLSCASLSQALWMVR